MINVRLDLEIMSFEITTIVDHLTLKPTVHQELIENMIFIILVLH